MFKEKGFLVGCIVLFVCFIDNREKIGDRGIWKNPKRREEAVDFTWPVDWS